MLHILLQTPSPSGGFPTGFIFVILMLLVLYFFMIRPQQKRQKEQKRYIEALKVGDLIVTVGGLHGKVISVSKDTLVLEIDKGTKVTLERSSVSYEASKRRS